MKKCSINPTFRRRVRFHSTLVVLLVVHAGLFFSGCFKKPEKFPLTIIVVRKLGDNSTDKFPEEIKRLCLSFKREECSDVVFIPDAHIIRGDIKNHKKVPLVFEGTGLTGFVQKFLGARSPITHDKNISKSIKGIGHELSKKSELTSSDLPEKLDPKTLILVYQKGGRESRESSNSDCTSRSSPAFSSINFPVFHDLEKLRDKIAGEICKRYRSGSSVSCLILYDPMYPKADGPQTISLPDMAVVPPGNYPIPNYLDNWIRDSSDITVEQQFDIMKREVTVAEFRCYVDTLGPADRERLGDAWKEDNEQLPVSSVPWWAARGYADWLSQTTGHRLALPTYSHWKAAAVRYARPEHEVFRRWGDSPNPALRSNPIEGVMDLLGNFREWSAGECENGGHYALGEDYLTWEDQIEGGPICLDRPEITVGIRLIEEG